MVLVDIEKFKQWLRETTNLAETSILLYGRVLNKYFSENKENINIEEVNRFISDSFRKHNSFYFKFVFKYYFDYINKPDLYKQLIKIKVRPRKKLGKYLPDLTIKKLIEAMRTPKYKDIAILQYSTGARAREIITLTEQNIDINYSEKVIKVRFYGKGGKEGISFISKEMMPIFTKYLRNKKGYIFLQRDIESPEDLEREVHRERTYYYISLNNAARSIGIDSFGTHDFRRNVAEQVRKKCKDPYIVKKVLRHSDIRTTLRYFEENPEEIEGVILERQTR